MDEIEKFKAFLGSTSEDYTEVQLRQLRREIHAMAELLLDIYLHEKRNETQAPAPILTDFGRPHKI